MEKANDIYDRRSETARIKAEANRSASSLVLYIEKEALAVATTPNFCINGWQQ